MATVASKWQRDTFQKVADHLLTQGRKSVTVVSSLCQYRVKAKDGTMLKCAIGCLIPDDLYEGAMDPPQTGLSVWNLLHSYPKLAVAIGVDLDKDMMFLQGLQAIHDCDSPDQWEEQLIRYAGGMGMVYHPPTK